jgi:hypothetical protein
MEKFLIEVPHGADKNACNQAVQMFLQTGSHFLTHAEWGCKDGEHKAWIMAEFNNKEEARMILPPLFRNLAHITQLTTFSAREIIKPEEFHKQGF